MGKSLGKSLALYGALLSDIRSRIQHAQHRAIRAANAELVRLYWDIGRLILVRKHSAGWGAGVIPRLARDLRNELPEIKGFSERNIDLMLQFAGEYPGLFAISQPVVAKIEQNANKEQGQAAAWGCSQTAPISQPVVAKLERGVESRALATIPSAAAPMRGGPPVLLLAAQLPWAHNVILMQLVKDRPTRYWYMNQALEHGWSRNILALMINNQVHLRQGKAITNFATRLPAAQADAAIQLLKDPYLFDFLTLEEPYHECELEGKLLEHLQRFLLELGQGFALVGRQYRLRVGEKDYSIDLLFYHLRLRCYFAIDLKIREFEAEQVGKMNFYLNVLDDKVRLPADAPSIGLILCRKRDRVIAEYALRGVNKPIGISEYALTRALPRELASSLPTIGEIEAELETQLAHGKPRVHATGHRGTRVRTRAKARKRTKGRL